jgi:hypothetical protein
VYENVVENMVKSVNVLNLHRINLAKLYTHLRREFDKGEEGEKE